MKTRTTIKVAELIDKANYLFAASADKCSGSREGIAIFLDTILHDTNTYAGFGYLYKKDLKGLAITPGITKNIDGFEFLDETRVIYYKHRKLLSKE
jgi:hypothetical protein